MPDDMIINLELINVNIEKRSIPFLKDCEVNFDKDNFGGQLTRKAPDARLPHISPDSAVAGRWKYVIYKEVERGVGSQGGEGRVWSVLHTRRGEEACWRPTSVWPAVRPCCGLRLVTRSKTSSILGGVADFSLLLYHSAKHACHLCRFCATSRQYSPWFLKKL